MDIFLKKVPCKYGEKCYQKNPEHHKKFDHPKPNEKKEDSEYKNKESDSSPPQKKLKVSPPENTSVQSVSGESNDDKEQSDNEDDDDNILIPETLQTDEEHIKQMFLVDMPRDFYDFWDFCKTVCEKHPEDALLDIGLKLVGPFDVLNGHLKSIPGKKLFQCLCHWRFYFDPPEFQTVIVGDKNEFHIGYFRDDPVEDPVFLASMSSLKPAVIQPMKEDLFSTIYSYINSHACKGKNTLKESLSSKIKDFAIEKKYNLTQTSDRLKVRKKKVVAKSFHGAGIVVPFDKENDVGYREIPETDANLRRILKNIVEAKSKEVKAEKFEVLQEIITNAQWASDEGDFGMGLELGIDLFMIGSKDFDSCVLHLLTVAYYLLKRDPFKKVIKAHIRNRRKGSHMNAFDEQKD